MDRIIFKKNKQRKFIKTVQQKSELSFFEIGKICGKHGKTINGWALERTSMPYECAIKLAKKFSIDLPYDVEIKKVFWYAAQSGKKGGLLSQKKYGNPGTKKGRQLGGKHSAETHRKKKTAFKQRKKINIPTLSKNLAEFIGIILGDGSITKYQVTISISNLVDQDYGQRIEALIKKLFNLRIKKSVRNNTLYLTISSVALVDYLVKYGLLIGNKINNKINIPSWILEKKSFYRSCIRRLIDTDGCIYTDKHVIKNKKYNNINLDYTSANPLLLKTVFKLLKKEGLNFQIYKKSIKLRKEKEIKKYFKIIGSSNKKHLNKYKKFFISKYGEVA